MNNDLSFELHKLELERVGFTAERGRLREQLVAQKERVRFHDELKTQLEQLRIRDRLIQLDVKVEPLEEKGTFLASLVDPESIDRLGERAQLLAEHGGIIELDLSGARLEEVSLGDLTTLQTLDLSSCRSLRSVKDLQGLTGVQTLYLSDRDELMSLEGLQGMKSLVALDINRLSVEHLKGLEKLTQLQSLRWISATDLKGMSSLPLKELDLRLPNKELSDFQPLAQFPNLEVVYTHGFREDQEAAIRKVFADAGIKAELDDSEDVEYRYPPPKTRPWRRGRQGG